MSAPPHVVAGRDLLEHDGNAFRRRAGDRLCDIAQTLCQPGSDRLLVSFNEGDRDDRHDLLPVGVANLAYCYTLLGDNTEAIALDVGLGLSLLRVERGVFNQTNRPIMCVAAF